MTGSTTSAKANKRSPALVKRGGRVLRTNNAKSRLASKSFN